MGVSFSSSEWIRLCIFIICSFLYLGVFLSLATFLSCLTKRSSSSFLFLLVIWVFSVLIIPRASVLIAGNMVEVPSLNSIFFQQNQLERQYSIERSKKSNEYSRKLDQEIYKKSGDSDDKRKEYLSKLNDFFEKMDMEYDKKVEDFVGRLYEERRNKQIKQEKLAFGISRISPAAIFTLVSSKLCGTSIDLKNHFYENATAYSKFFAEFIKGKTGHNIGAESISMFDPDGEKNKKPPQPINPGEIPCV